ncbi:hypothetical protein [Dulcicalothrix desertica]|uniref:hypothetical protein n=1 Tax=Dulcicalothrix desertica TaxID=32056 RepID=UPI000F8F0614|nr:hypothetical protein [Dulcicalothrix desertica]
MLDFSFKCGVLPRSVPAVGDTWRFGKLDKQSLHITQDITLYRVPDDLDILMQILIGIIE